MTHVSTTAGVLGNDVLTALAADAVAADAGTESTLPVAVAIVPTAPTPAAPAKKRNVNTKACVAVGEQFRGKVERIMPARNQGETPYLLLSKPGTPKGSRLCKLSLKALPAKGEAAQREFFEKTKQGDEIEVKVFHVRTYEDREADQFVSAIILLEEQGRAARQSRDEEKRSIVSALTVGSLVKGKVMGFGKAKQGEHVFGVFVSVGNLSDGSTVDGLLHGSAYADQDRSFELGDEVEVKILSVEQGDKGPRIALSELAAVQQRQAEVAQAAAAELLATAKSGDMFRAEVTDRHGKGNGVTVCVDGRVSVKMSDEALGIGGASQATLKTIYVEVVATDGVGGLSLKRASASAYRSYLKALELEASGATMEAPATDDATA